MTVLAWPNMVVALRSARYSPAIWSATFKNSFILSSNGIWKCQAMVVLMFKMLN